MIYQKLLVGKKPYFAHVADFGSYPLHRHPEFELSYCIAGEYPILVEGKRYLLSAGELAIVKPMAAHEFLSDEFSKARTLVVNFGPLFLDDFYEPLLKLSFDSVVYNIKEEPTLSSLICELVHFCEHKSSFSELAVRGNIYKISSMLPSLVSKSDRTSLEVKSLQDMAKVDRALNIIYEEYRSNIDLEYVSSICGYSKSNFCKVFKTVTGDTFHNVLNSHRVEIAKMHLKGSDSSIEMIAAEVGFSDAKSFCRVFKRVCGHSPGTYRRSETN